MRYFSLLSLGNDQDRSLVFLDREPDELAEHGYRLAQGKTMRALYPDTVSFVMQPQSPGIKLSTLIGNTLNLLIVHEAMKSLIESTKAGPIELWPTRILNHKGRLHASDYWIANPIGSIQCIDFKRSEISYSDASPGRILSIDRLVLVGNQLKDAPDLFRVPDFSDCIVSERLVRAMQGRGFTNIYFVEHDVTDTESE